MAVEFNKVTWYSKLLAMVLFVALPFVGLGIGYNYGEATGLSLQLGSGKLPPPPSPIPDYYQNPPAWQTDTRPDAGFSLAFPLDFPVDDAFASTPTLDWRVG